MLKKFWNDEAGLETIEYVIMACVIVLGLIVTMTSIGTKIATKFAAIDAGL